jgi:RNA polymerase sigma-70 factor (ECF subfamily)
MSKATLTCCDWAGLEELRGDVEHTLRYSVRDRNELDDLVQETFVRAARFRGGLKNPDRLRPWVRRIAWNVLRDHLRRQGRQRTVEVGEKFLTGIEGREGEPGHGETHAMDVGRCYMDRDELANLLTEIMPGLSGEERQLLEAYYGQGCTCLEAALELGVSTESVKMRLFRLRKRLRSELLRRTGLGRSALACDEVVA